MRLKDIDAEVTFELWVKPEPDRDALNEGIGHIAPDNGGQAYTLRIERKKWKILLLDSSAVKDLDFHLKSDCAHLAEVIRVAKDGNALVRIMFFNKEMKLKDINAEITFELCMKRKNDGKALTEGIGYIVPYNAGKEYKLRIEGRQWNVLLQDASDGKDLNFHLNRGCAHLAEVIKVAKDGSALVKIIFFNREMRLKDINAENTFELWVKPELDGDTLNEGIGYIAPDNSDQAYKLRIEGEQWNVLLQNASDGKDLNFYLKRGCAHLAEVIQVTNDGSALVRIIFFNGDIVDIGDVDIGIDKRIESTAQKKGLSFNSTEELGKLLITKLTLHVNGESYFCMYSGKSANEDFEYTESDEEQIDIAESLRSFSLCGDRVSIPVGKLKLSEFEESFHASKAIFRDHQKLRGSLRLAKGKLTFSSTPERIKALAAETMNRLTKETGGYLKQWDEYGAIEGEILLAKAKAVGRIDYQGTEQTTKGVKFFVSSIPDKLTEGDAIEITSEEPLYLENPDLTWEEYSKALEEEFTSKKNKKKNDADNDTASVYAPILNLSKKSIELDLTSIPSGQMFLILSINGDKTQIERRMQAREAILTGDSANAYLGLLIEEGASIPETQRGKKLKPLTPFVKEKIFKHAPTDKQVKAIDIALNTPDIALIQGPPGTGKTTVITAILERLNEEMDKKKSIRGQILVSAFQHDAVENIVARLSINALPAVKFGRKSDDSEFAEDAVTEKISKWCSNVAENIRNKNPQIAQTEDQVRLVELFVAYSLCPSKNNTISLMKRMLNLPRDVIEEGIINEAEEIIKSMQSPLKPNDPSTLRLIRAMRISEAAFKDDGVARAVDLLDKIEAEISDSDLSILEKATRWCSDKPLNFLPELRSLKESLLYKYLPSPDFRTEKPREDVLKLVVTVSQLLKKKLTSTDKRDAILAEFLHELEDNPDGVREAIEDYNFVFAATTGHSEGKAIRRAKKKFNREELLRYDTVIIDEAARVSPRDLMIPLAQAEKRIILVGDHRQLPHMIDDEVAKALESDDSSGLPVDVDFVKKSMFEYLFKRLKKLEEKDGVKRTVTLDAQYRTHPLLGDFISNNFYQKYGEGYQSPLSKTFFEQKLQGIENKAAVWIDVPNSQGKEVVLQSRSRQRIPEAKVIAEYVNKWIDTDEGSRLSFGIISFYKAQVSAVYDELRRYGITERAPDGTWQICQKYRFFENGEERLRIGTVDAFQGMEFDIVFLSMVRSQDIKALPPHIHKEKNYKKKQQKVFGHLMSENRLCVSMSRQKKVLIIVGDGMITNTKIAVDAVPALKNFYNLCKKKGVIL